MKQLKVTPQSLMQAGDSSKELTTSPEHMRLAVQKATQLFGCYRRDDATDADTFVAAISVILSHFEPGVIERVCHPWDGLPSKNKWPPNPAEVREACEAAKAFFAAERVAIEKGWKWDGEKWGKVA